MILSGPEIRRQVMAGRITIKPFAEDQLNPNSYNYRLGPRLLELGSLHDQRGGEARDLRDGPIVLEPRTVYLGHTMETIGSKYFVTMLNGRSSVGRLGMFLNYSADLGHLGAVHQWTLEIKVVQRLRVYFAMKVGQATFWVPRGNLVPYGGAYGDRSEPTPNLRQLKHHP